MVLLRNGIAIEVMCESITDFYGDGLIVPNNTSLDLDSELLQSLGKKAGRSTLSAAAAKGPITLGEAVITPGGGLLSNFIIHVALFPSGLQPVQSRAEKIHVLSSGVKNGLLRCSELGLESVGIPNVGEYLGVSVEESLRILVAAVGDLQVPPGNPLKKVFVLFEEDRAAQIFCRIISAVSV